jgi:hypothetical protein
LKKGIRDGITAAQICRSEEEIPKALFPVTRRNGTINPISGPATYQGHGCLNQSGIAFFYKDKLGRGHYRPVESNE